MFKFPDIDPVIISIGPMAVSWYSLSYVVGILIGWYYINKIIETQKNIKITKEKIDDYITWIIIGIIIGGRLGYVIFYDPAKYLADPIRILKTYEGGMSFHGGLAGYIISSYLFALRKKISFLEITDLSAAAAPIAIFLGRIANFINGELYGRITDSPLGMVFPGTDGIARHPSQIYEALLEGLLLFVILNIFTFKLGATKKRGLLSGSFLLFYTIFRSFVEFFREPDVQIGFFFEIFTMGQILSIPMLIGGLFLIFKSQQNVYQLKNH